MGGGSSHTIHEQWTMNQGLWLLTNELYWPFCKSITLTRRLGLVVDDHGSIIMTIKIGEKVRINPILQSLFPSSVPLLRPIPIVDIVKLKTIKGITKRKNTKTHPPPPCTSLMPSFIPMVIIKAINAVMIERTPRPFEVWVLREYLLGGIGGSSFI